MIIFIRNIPATSKLSELELFVGSVLKRTLFVPSGRVVKSEILALKDTKTQLIEYHGLVHIEPDKAARRAIKQLNGKRFHNRPVMVREYVDRSWRNDRRENHAEVFDENRHGKRKGDRRRNLEIVQDLSRLFTTTINRARKLI